MKRKERKGFLVTDNLIPWIIVVLVIVLTALVYGIFSGKLQAFLDVLRNARRSG